MARWPISSAPARRRPCRSCARTSSSIRTSSGRRRSPGADAVLLIVAALADEDLRLLWEEAAALDLDCLVEVHDEDDLERALDLDPEVIGINNRSLRDMQVDLATTEELVTDVPAGKIVVAESGYRERDQIEELDRIGVDAVLIGETLMRCEDPEAMVRSMALEEDLTREHLLSDER